MEENINKIDENRKDSTLPDGSLDWEDIERKVQIISRRFSTTIDWKYREDMEQELRLFAWKTSSNYYDMYRRAVDYWRTLTRKVFPEICVFEFDDNNGQGGITEDKYDDNDEFVKMIDLIRDSIDDYQNTNHERTDRENCMKILDLLEKSISEGSEIVATKGKIRVSWVSEILDIPYNKVQDAIWLLQQVVTTLGHLHRIDIPTQYRREYKPF